MATLISSKEQTLISFDDARISGYEANAKLV